MLLLPGEGAPLHSCCPDIGAWPVCERQDAHIHRLPIEVGGWIVAERSGRRWGEEFTDRLTVKMEKRNKSGTYVPTCAIGTPEFWNGGKETCWINENTIIIVQSKIEAWKQPPEAEPSSLNGISPHIKTFWLSCLRPLVFPGVSEWQPTLLLHYMQHN